MSPADLLAAATALLAADPELASLANVQEVAGLLREALPGIRAVAASRRLPRIPEPPQRGPVECPWSGHHD